MTELNQRHLGKLCPPRQMWVGAKDEEMRSLHQSGTWKIVDTPKSKTTGGM